MRTLLRHTAKGSCERFSTPATRWMGVVAASLFVLAYAVSAEAISLTELLTSLKLDKTAIQFADPAESGQAEGGQAEEPTTQAVPDEFRGDTGRLNATGGSLVVLESTPPGRLPADLTTLGPQFISDILLFLPNAKTFFMFSEPFPSTFHVPTYDSNGVVNGEAFLSLTDLLSTAGGRRVNTIQEGFLIDQRTRDNSGNPVPYGNDPVNIAQMFELNNVTIFVNRFTASTSQAYVILSDNPVPEPTTLVLIASGLIGLGASSYGHARRSRRSCRDGKVRMVASRLRSRYATRARVAPPTSGG